MFRLKREKVDFQHPLGKGGFSVVYPYGDKHVVKYILTHSLLEVVQTFQEIALSFNHDHPRLVPAKGFHLEYNEPDYKIWIKMNRMKCNLKQVIDEHVKTKKYFSKQELINYIYTLSHTLEYLHSKGIAHHDIKPQNILVDEKNRVFLSDLGIGHFVSQDDKSKLTYIASGTPAFMAPELKDRIIKKKDLFKTDVWGLGLVMIELADLEDTQINLHMQLNDVKREIHRKLKKIQSRYGPELAELIAAMLKIDPKERANSAQVKEMALKEFPYLINDKLYNLKECMDDLTRCKEEVRKLREKINKKGSGTIRDNGGARSCTPTQARGRRQDSKIAVITLQDSEEKKGDKREDKEEMKEAGEGQDFPIKQSKSENVGQVKDSPQSAKSEDIPVVKSDKPRKLSKDRDISREKVSAKDGRIAPVNSAIGKSQQQNGNSSSGLQQYSIVSPANNSKQQQSKPNLRYKKNQRDLSKEKLFPLNLEKVATRNSNSSQDPNSKRRDSSEDKFQPNRDSSRDRKQDKSPKPIKGGKDQKKGKVPSPKNQKFIQNNLVEMAEKSKQTPKPRVTPPKKENCPDVVNMIKQDKTACSDDIDESSHLHDEWNVNFDEKTEQETKMGPPMSFEEQIQRKLVMRKGKQSIEELLQPDFFVMWDHSHNILIEKASSEVNDNSLKNKFNLDLITALKKISELNSLEINLNQCTKITNYGGSFIGNLLTTISQLTNISMNFQDCHQLSDDGLWYVTEPLAKNKNLKSIKLSFGNCNISDEGLANLPKAFSHLIQLEELNLNINFCKNITDRGLQQWSTTLSQIKSSLKSLRMIIGGSTSLITDKGLVSLGNLFVQKNSFHSFELELFDMSGITDRGVASFCTYLIKLQDLKHLRLSFQSFDKKKNIGDNTLNVVAKSLNMLNNLSSLELDFNGVGSITDQGLKTLSECLSKNQGFSKLGLSVAESEKVTDAGIQYLAEALKSLPSIEHLDLDFSSTDIKDEGIDIFSQSVSQLKGLEYLTFKVCNCQQVGDSGLIEIGHCLVKLKGLISLKLNFNGCEQIDNLGIQGFSEALCQFENLKELYANWQKCPLVNNEGVANIDKAVIGLKSLAYHHITYDKDL